MKRYLLALMLAATALSCSSSHDDDPASGGGGVLCPMSLWIAPGIMVEVRDAVTGRPIACGASGKAEGGGVIAPLETGVDCNVAPDYLYLSGVNAPGTFTVTIEHPAYQTLTIINVNVLGGICGLATVQLRADLQPL